MGVMRLVCVAAFFAAMSGCSTAPQSEQGKLDLQNETSASLAKAQALDPSLAPWLGTSAGYAVFPSVAKGGVGVGGAHGQGLLFVGGHAVGYCDVSQTTIGAQLGGQSYLEIICFETPAAVALFQQGDLHFAAQATAVALKSGAGANAKYVDGVAVFTMAESGLMFEASIGGQSFGFQPR